MDLLYYAREDIGLAKTKPLQEISEDSISPNFHRVVLAHSYANGDEGRHGSVRVIRLNNHIVQIP